MSETNEPRLQPDYAHDPDDTLAIVPNGDSDDYSRLLGDLQRERMLRVEAQTERDRATRKAKLYENLVVELALEILSFAHGEMSQDSLVQQAREILGDDEPATTAPEG